jgi:hypothetical protein
MKPSSLLSYNICLLVRLLAVQNNIYCQEKLNLIIVPYLVKPRQPKLTHIQLELMHSIGKFTVLIEDL